MLMVINKRFVDDKKVLYQVGQIEFLFDKVNLARFNLVHIKDFVNKIKKLTACA